MTHVENEVCSSYAPVARVEKANIEAALRRARGVKSHAARMLGISRPTLDKKLADFKIDIWAKE